jgi:hypothetical protein
MFKVGDPVVSERFGEGVVSMVRKAVSHPVTVAFNRGEVKTFTREGLYTKLTYSKSNIRKLKETKTMMTLDEQYEVVKAKKEGKEIEIECGGDWEHFNGKSFNFVNFQYRVKSELLECWVNVYDNGHGSFCSKDDAINNIDEGCLRAAVHLREVKE